MKTVNDFYLSVWLREATECLCDDARERVTLEIRSHYADRVAAELALGRSEDEAHAFAMAGLGSSKVARKAYNRVYLTKGDEYFFNHDLSPKLVYRMALWVWLAINVLSVYFLTMSCYYGYREHHDSQYFLALCCILLVPVVCALAAGAYGFWRAPRLYRQGRLRAAISWHCIFQFSFFLSQGALPIAGILWSAGSDWKTYLFGITCGATVIVFSAASSGWMYLHLSRKLGGASPSANPGGMRA